MSSTSCIEALQGPQNEDLILARVYLQPYWVAQHTYSYLKMRQNSRRSTREARGAVLQGEIQSGGSLVALMEEVTSFHLAFNNCRILTSGVRCMVGLGWAFQGMA
jgi:hypothetical protein